MKVLTGQGAATDLSGKFVFGIFAALAEFERESRAAMPRRARQHCWAQRRQRPAESRRPALPVDRLPAIHRFHLRVSARVTSRSGRPSGSISAAIHCSGRRLRVASRADEQVMGFCNDIGLAEQVVREPARCTAHRRPPSAHRVRQQSPVLTTRDPSLLPRQRLRDAVAPPRRER